MEKYQNPLEPYSSKHARRTPTLQWLILALMVILGTALSLTGYADEANPATAVYPPVNYGVGAKAEQIKRGEYLVKAGDCIACHTDSSEGGDAFAGGLPMETPFGTIYSPNITPDKETGIGNWSIDQFDRALRQGINPKGEFLLPAFPYPFYNKLTRQDVLDIKAYLDAIPAVHAVNRPLDMPWPFHVRLLQSFWRFMFFDFHKGEFVPDTTKPQEWNRGAYLVEGLGHCAMCHTPVNAIGGWERQYDYTGGKVGSFYAPNISANRLKDVPTEKVVEVFTKDTLLQGGPVKGPMLEVNHDSLRYLSKEDLSAMVTYLKTVKSKMPPAPVSGTGPEAGKNIYEKYCAGCHTMGSGGAPKFGDSTQWSPVVQMGLAQVYNNAIKGINGMPAKGNCDSCTDDQVKSAVDYILDNSRGQSTAAATIDPAEAYTSLAKGKKVYDEVCTVCHTGGQLGAPKLGDKAAWKPLLKENMDVLVERAIDGYKGHPAMGACYQCSDADVISAVKYMAQEGGNGDYKLW